MKDLFHLFELLNVFIDGEMQSGVIWADLRNKRTPTKGTQNHVIELCGGLLWSGAGLISSLQSLCL